MNAPTRTIKASEAAGVSGQVLGAREDSGFSGSQFLTHTNAVVQSGTTTARSPLVNVPTIPYWSPRGRDVLSCETLLERLEALELSWLTDT